MGQTGDQASSLMLSWRESIRVFGKLLPYFRRNLKYFLLAVTLLLVNTQLNVAVPLLVRMVIDDVIIGGKSQLAVPLIGGILAVSLAVGFLFGVRRYINAKFAGTITYELRVNAFRAVQRQSFSFFDRISTGQLISRITNDTSVLSRFFSRQLSSFLSSIFTLAMAVAALMTMDFKLTAIGVAMTPFLFLIYFRYGKIIRPLYLSMRQQYGVLASVVNNTLTGVRTVKSLGLEEYEAQKFDRENDKYLRLALKAARISATYNPLSWMVIGVAMTLVLFVGGVEIIEGRLTIGELTAAVSYLTMLMWPLRALGMFITSFQRSMTAAQRVVEIIESIPEVKEKPGAIPLPRLKGHIKFEDVWFGYDAEHMVLKGVNLEIRPGECVAILGPTGSGKSSLIRLIPRFYDPTKGRVLVDGYDLRDVKLRSLRRQIAILSQEPYIFAGTIKDNILFGNPKASMEDVVRAAKAAKIHDFVASLPRGYDTPIGERGVTLSGGQRQRLALARALVRDPRILILDDPTSNLDAETERRLVEDLKEVVRGRTTIVVTQRPSLIRLADRIVVMDGGRIVEEGSHEELMARKGLYYKLYTSFALEEARPVAEVRRRGVPP